MDVEKLFRNLRDANEFCYRRSLLGYCRLKILVSLRSLPQTMQQEQIFQTKKNNNKSRVLNLSVEMQNNFYFQVDRHLKMKQKK